MNKLARLIFEDLKTISGAYYKPVNLHKQLKRIFKAIKNNIESKNRERLKELIVRVEEINKSLSAPEKSETYGLQSRLLQINKVASTMIETLKENQKVIDGFVEEYKK